MKYTILLMPLPSLEYLGGLLDRLDRLEKEIRHLRLECDYPFLLPYYAKPEQLTRIVSDVDSTSANILNYCCWWCERPLKLSKSSVTGCTRFEYMRGPLDEKVCLECFEALQNNTVVERVQKLNRML